MAFTVDGPLEVYTLVFAWQQYNNLWLILTTSGIAFLPFLGVMIQSFMAAASSQIDLSTSLLMMRRIETKVISMFVVILLAAQPSVSLKLNEMKFSAPCKDGKPNPELLTINEDNSALKNMHVVKFVEDIKIPPWWFAVMSISTGFTQAAKFTLPCELPNNSDFLSTSTLDNPEIANEVRVFIADCYFPALAKFDQIVKDGSRAKEISDIKKRLNKEGGLLTFENEMNWFASDIFMRDVFLAKDFFKIMRSKRPEGDALETLSCQDWYLGQSPTDPKALKNKLKISSQYKECEKNDIAFYKEKRFIFNSTKLFYTPFGYLETEEDLAEYFCLRKVHAFGARESKGRALLETLNSSTLVINQRKWFQDTTSALSSMWARFIEGAVTTSVTAEYAPIALSMIIMAVIAILPFGIVFSSYNMQFMMTASVALFSLIFTNYLFFLVSWIQNVLFLGMKHQGFSTPSSSIFFNGNGTIFLNNVIMIVSNTLYLIFPAIAISVFTWGGMQIGLDIQGLLTRLTAPAQKAAAMGGSIVRFMVNAILSRYTGGLIRI